jgi:predicted Rossmann fold nucleotide-binding protein DprA/Smf involved in DNA uptake
MYCARGFLFIRTGLVVQLFPMETLLPQDFPLLLKEITDPPKKLYLRGVLPSPTLKLLAVVGSRALSSYGKEVTKNLIAGLKGYPIGIVSGLALGTDALAHEAALTANRAHFRESQACRDWQ